ncbi:cadmium resistance transporter [Laspinema olomoucense]|uniref:cadmium resistance transporter n=1 Tax=Laspinema olomoucense TaxID=3231600 RepID=UPI0021BB7B1F|nr:cadmium resistance transporter [Laspinema sp. D3d]MCT7972070.1 cadmium resistance transporter [Laspinema sp. D3d]
MSSILTAVVTGITSFAATNIDDITLSMLLFSQTNNRGFHPRDIVIGNYLGFTILILACLPGLFGGLFLPPPGIGLLGFIPIAIGIKQLLVRQSDDEPQVQGIITPGEPPLQKPSRWPRWLTYLSNSQIYNVAALTVVNGGDNIGIYVPIFASNRPIDLAVILVIFYVLVGVWSAIAYYLSRHRAITLVLTRYGLQLTPFILITLGLFILIDNQSYRLLAAFN